MLRCSSRRMRWFHRDSLQCDRFMTTRRPSPRRADRDHRRRTLSQNFLTDKGVGLFVDALDLPANALVYEVGAGRGSITARVAPTVKRIRAFEIDSNFARLAEEKLSGLQNVEIMTADFLSAREPATPFYVIGNVPFSVTSGVVD